jgi:carboxymethylenebutenolidase
VSVDPDIVVTPAGTPVERLAPVAPRAGVVLVSEVGGIDPVLRDYAARLVAEGWFVAMPDLWWRTGRPTLGTSERVAAAVAALADHEALADIAAARSVLPPGLPTFVLGFCVGGLYARMAGCALVGLAGVVEFYGRIVYPTITATKPVQPLDLLPGLGCPIQCHFGSEDPVAPQAHVDELERRLATRPRASQVFRYPGCTHAFMNPERPGWDPAAARLAWQRAVNFIEHFATPPER